MTEEKNDIYDIKALWETLQKNLLQRTIDASEGTDTTKTANMLANLHSLYSLFERRDKLISDKGKLLLMEETIEKLTSQVRTSVDDIIEKIGIGMAKIMENPEKYPFFLDILKVIKDLKPDNTLSEMINDLEKVLKSEENKEEFEQEKEEQANS